MSISDILTIIVPLILLILGWIWARVTNVQQGAVKDNDMLEEKVKDIKDEVNKLKVELPTNYATKDDLNILKSDILSEIREGRQYTKEMYERCIGEVKSLLTPTKGE
jgi:uncharacterized membrane-anchored protein YhcB (DUF1043 family)